MPRQRMEPGTWGRVTVRPVGDAFRATAYVRLLTGKRVEREATSHKSAEDARRELLRRIAVELESGEPTGTVTSRTTLSELFEVWLPAKIAEDRIGGRTVTLYRDTWNRHGRNQIGDLRITELRTSRADAYLKSLSPSAGTYLRVILAGMFSTAVRFDVLSHNPIRETKLAKRETTPARAVTAIELEEIRQAVRVFCERRGPGPRRAPMLAPFVELLAATGARPSEVLAIEWDGVDLLGDPPTVTVTGTVQGPGSVKGKATHRQAWRKGHAPAHTVTLPRFGVDVLTALLSVTGPTGTVLKNRDGGLLSLSNIRSSLREALADREHLHWVTPYSFRRSVASVVRDGLGVEAAQQQLSHAQLATTERHYVERVTAGPDTRSVLGKWAGKQK